MHNATHVTSTDDTDDGEYSASLTITHIFNIPCFSHLELNTNIVKLYRTLTIQEQGVK